MMGETENKVSIKLLRMEMVYLLNTSLIRTMPATSYTKKKKINEAGKQIFTVHENVQEWLVSFKKHCKVFNLSFFIGFQ